MVRMTALGTHPLPEGDIEIVYGRDPDQRNNDQRELDAFVESRGLNWKGRKKKYDYEAIKALIEKNYAASAICYALKLPKNAVQIVYNVAKLYGLHLREQRRGRKAKD